MTTYSPPVDQLLRLGEPDEDPGERDYGAYGIGPEQIPDLIRMALDPELHRAPSSRVDVWGPLHAWRALGQLRASTAIEPLTHLLPRIDADQDDWIAEDLPVVFGMMGPAAIPVLAGYLADSQNGLWARVATTEALKQIAEQYPDARSQCIAVLAPQLERFEHNDATINTYVMSALIDLNAVASAPVMARAFAANAIDPMVAGDWEDVQIALGLQNKRTTSRKRSGLADLVAPPRPSSPPPPPPNPQVDQVIAQMQADGVLKTQKVPQSATQKKKHKRKRK